jgi:hypothetical protein
MREWSRGLSFDLCPRINRWLRSKNPPGRQSARPSCKLIDGSPSPVPSSYTHMLAHCTLLQAAQSSRPWWPGQTRERERERERRTSGFPIHPYIRAHAHDYKARRIKADGRPLRTKCMKTLDRRPRQLAQCQGGSTSSLAIGIGMPAAFSRSDYLCQPQCTSTQHPCACGEMQSRTRKKESPSKCSSYSILLDE